MVGPAYIQVHYDHIETYGSKKIWKRALNILVYVSIFSYTYQYSHRRIYILIDVSIFSYTYQYSHRRINILIDVSIFSYTYQYSHRRINILTDVSAKQIYSIYIYVNIQSRSVLHNANICFVDIKEPCIFSYTYFHNSPV